MWTATISNIQRPIGDTFTPLHVCFVNVFSGCGEANRMNNLKFTSKWTIIQRSDLQKNMYCKKSVDENRDYFKIVKEMCDFVCVHKIVPSSIIQSLWTCNCFILNRASLQDDTLHRLILMWCSTFSEQRFHSAVYLMFNQRKKKTGQLKRHFLHVTWPWCLVHIICTDGTASLCSLFPLRER